MMPTISPMGRKLAQSLLIRLRMGSQQRILCNRIRDTGAVTSVGSTTATATSSGISGFRPRPLLDGARSSERLPDSPLYEPTLQAFHSMNDGPAPPKFTQVRARSAW